MSAGPVAVRIAAFNVHGWVPPGSCMDVGRFVETMRELEADIIGLQEVVIPPLNEPGCLETAVAVPLAMRAVPGPTMTRLRNQYGNVLLSRLPVLSWRTHDLSFRKSEPRGAIEALIDVGGIALKVVTTHFGLRRAERQAQARALLGILGDNGHLPVAVLGDFNEWLPGNRSVSLLDRHLGKSPSLPTFPSCFPVLSLDRLWVSPRRFLKRLSVHRPTQVACSDHLPLVAEVELEPVDAAEAAAAFGEEGQKCSG